MYKSCIKRKIDFIVSLIALIVFSPILILVAILVRFNLGSPVIFKQERPGLNEEIFTLYEGKCQGQIVGGNLSLINTSLGTEYEIDTKDKILFIEETSEYVYNVMPINMPAIIYI